MSAPGSYRTKAGQRAGVPQGEAQADTVGDLPIKGGLTAILLAFFAAALLCGPAGAASEEEIDQAISDGLEWLVSKQSENGYFGDQYGYALAAKTSFAVLKLEEYAFETGYASPFDPDYKYSQNVTDGLNYIFSRANGGWGYHHGEMWSDNSNTGYAVLGLMYSEQIRPDHTGERHKRPEQLDRLHPVR
ncbi:MAG TPA: hypothetical protein PKK11_02990 [Methanothrix sp.]|nr:hypothetical protein [Methanothrix sp.]